MGTCALKSWCKFSREVMKSWPALLAEVVIIGKPSFSTTVWIQWLGILTPRVLPPGFTAWLTAFLFFSSRIRVNGPGSFCTHFLSFSDTLQFFSIHSFEGAMMENGAVFLALSSLIFLTAASSFALQPMP